MVIPSRDSEGAPSSPYPSSSPLSSPVDVDLSDSSFLDEVHTNEPQAGVTVGLQLGRDNQPNLNSVAANENAKHSRIQPQHTLDDEDELSRDPTTIVAAEENEISVAAGGESTDGNTELETSNSSRRTRRMPSRQKKIILKQPPKSTPKKTVWTTERLLTDPKSPLAKADLRSIVANPMAWDVLDVETRAEILALFPHKHMILDAGTENARPDIAAMMNDDTFRGDCAGYTEHIAQGRHDHDWLTDAYNAHHRRSMGEFDDFMVQKVHDDWGVELPDDFRPRRMPQSREETDKSPRHVEKLSNDATEYGEKRLGSEAGDMIMEEALSTPH